MPTNLPYGNAFLVNTPSLDRYGAQLYQDQRIREARAYEESRQLEKDMQADASKIRAADTPEFIGQYEKYKNIKKQLYNPKARLSATEVNKINQDANIELSKAMQLANDSIEMKERQKQLIAERQKRFDYFNDDFNDRFNRVQNTPLSKMDDDLKDFNNFYYKGNVTNLQPLLDKAKGTQRPIGQPEVNENFSPIEREITSYKGYNSPRQYYNTLIGSLRGQRAQQDLLTSVDYTPEEESALVDRYNDFIKTHPEVEKIYGKDNLNFPESSDYSDVGRTAKLLAMEHAMTAITPETKRETKQEEKRKAGMEDWLKKNGITYQQALSKIRLSASLQGKGGSNYKVEDLVTEDGNTDLTKPLQGINVNNLVTGKSFKSDKTIYNPRTKEITFHDIVDDKDYTVPAGKFRQIINTINTVQDLKVYDNLIEGIDKAYAPPKQSTTKNRPPLTDFIKHK